MVRSENLHDGSPGGGRRRAVLLVADLLHPVDDFAVQILGDGEMRSMRTEPVKGIRPVPSAGAASRLARCGSMRDSNPPRPPRRESEMTVAASSFMSGLSI